MDLTLNENTIQTTSFRHAFLRAGRYGGDVMRCAFVVRLEPITDLPGELEGWVEEVDTGRERRFHSTAELLLFLHECRCALLAGGSDELASTDPEKETED